MDTPLPSFPGLYVDLRLAPDGETLRRNFGGDEEQG
jgi:hypothetical protein